MEPHSDNRQNTIAVIPAFNEEIAIGSVVLRTKPYVNHVIVVDDGSRDMTSVIAASAGAEVIRLFKKPWEILRGYQRV